VQGGIFSRLRGSRTRSKGFEPSDTARKLYSVTRLVPENVNPRNFGGTKRVGSKLRPFDSVGSGGSS
jgi:hypothetical protein